MFFVDCCGHDSSGLQASDDKGVERLLVSDAAKSRCEKERRRDDAQSDFRFGAERIIEGHSMNRFFTKLKEELLAILPPTLYFFVALHLVVLIRVLMLEGTGIQMSTSVSITVAALILGKAVLIADLLPLINRYPEKPLIYNVVWKTLTYQMIAVAIHYLERLIDFSRQAGGVVAGNEEMLAEMIWPHFWAVQLLLFVLILPYCTMHELVRLIGKEKAKQMFFGPLPRRVA
jgi:hypothetical protein